MKVRVLLVMAAGLLIGAQAKDDVKKEMAKFKGTWSVVSFEVAKGDRGPSDKEIKEMKIIFGRDGEDSMVVKFGDKDEKPSTFKLDPSKNPKEIDLMPVGKDRIVKGIYQTR